MTNRDLQTQYDKIYSYFKTTYEHFSDLEWNGKILFVWKDENITEKYSLKDLTGLIFNET
ncbi:MAG: hypothetical protein Q8P76_01515 [bacterium]|nr:hypothetical protein [bacterium]